MKFVQGVMKSLDASTPSISSVKSVDIPGFVPPVKVYNNYTIISSTAITITSYTSYSSIPRVEHRFTLISLQQF